MKIAYLDGPRLRRALLAAGAHLHLRKAELNRINVFPVPDGDTGTNLALTVRAVTGELTRSRVRPISAVSKDAAVAAVLGARGNSGMMLSQFFLGFSTHLEGSTRADAKAVAGAVVAGAERVEGAIERPVEGTILTVIRDTARAARLSESTDIAHLLIELVEEARASLARTPDQLAVLREAGVVDAGAMGFVLLLEGALGYLEGRVEPDLALDGAEEAGGAALLHAAFSSERERFRYCVEALVRGESLPTESEVRDLLRELGDSLLAVRTGDFLKVHIHADEPDRVFAALRPLGDLRTHKAEDMEAQRRAAHQGGPRGTSEVRRSVGVVTDSACDLSDEVLAAHGIRIVPLEILDGEVSYRDRIDLSAESFHELLARADPRFTTSQPPPGAFLAAFRDASEDSEALVVVTLGSGLSGTYGSAEAARKMMPETPIHLMDSQGATLLQGLLVLKAAELAEGGAGGEEIVRELERIRDQAGVFLTVDRFDRLVASGRVGPGVAWVGTQLDLKPILRLDRSGKVVRVRQVRGRASVLPALMRQLDKEIPPSTRRVRFGVVHVARPEIVEEVTRHLRARWGEVEVLSAAATPVIANHVGRGAWALAFMVED